MTGDEIPERDHPLQCVRSSPQDEECTGPGRDHRRERTAWDGSLVVNGWGFGSITLHRACVKNLSCDLLRRERTAWNGSHFVVNVALTDEARASNDK
jgi:hypothetical protein